MKNLSLSALLILFLMLSACSSKPPSEAGPDLPNIVMIWVMVTWLVLGMKSSGRPMWTAWLRKE